MLPVRGIGGVREQLDERDRGIRRSARVQHAGRIDRIKLHLVRDQAVPVATADDESNCWVGADSGHGFDIALVA